eukprot:2010721-Alexandrium_andersonii.AAC.1
MLHPSGTWHCTVRPLVAVLQQLRLPRASLAGRQCDGAPRRPGNQVGPRAGLLQGHPATHGGGLS